MIAIQHDKMFNYLLNKYLRKRKQMSFMLNIREVVYALSEALDYVGIDDTMHGKRVAYMSTTIAKKIGWSKIQTSEILAMGMLHDCGVSSSDVHTHLVNELDWENSNVHCVRGYDLLTKVGLFHHYADVILYHHTHWDQFSLAADPAVRLAANMIYITDRIDALRAQIGYDSDLKRQTIKETIQKYSGTMFAPEFVEAFLEVSRSDLFWYTMESEISLYAYFDEWIEDGEEEIISFEQLIEIAEMFADIVDAKSYFTSEHTRNVAALASFLAQKYGLPLELRQTIELAGYFHDLGKLRVPDKILNKPGILTDEERSKINRHGYDSYMVLRKIKGFENISKIASMHHETLDAKGYPYSYTADKIPIEVRILTIADIFQALVQNRPYRAGLDAEQAYQILKEMDHDGTIDSSVLDVLYKHMDECYQYATMNSNK